jgi:hypothetical protein
LIITVKEAQGASKLSAYAPSIANAKVSVISLWKHLEELENMVDDPDQLHQRDMKIHDELQEC